MLLKNTTARLITINEKHTVTKGPDGKVIGSVKGKAYDIMPAGDAVEVPDDVFSKKYVDHLLSTGELIKVETKTIKEPDSDGKESILKLREEAEELGIKYDGRTSEKKLKQLIAEALE